MKQTIISKLLIAVMSFALMASSVFAAQSMVDLGTAGNYAILSKSGISTTGITSIVGDIGVSPIDATAITGFGLILDPSNTFSTSSLLTGKAYAADYTPPTPTSMTAAISDMETAYTDAAGRTLPDFTELGAGNVDGMTLIPGLYKWGTGVDIPNGVTLSGGANDIWIFQIAQNLNIGNGAIITLSGGAQAKNIFWQVGGMTIIGTTSDVKGIILSKTAISMNTGAKLNGRALSQTAVTLDANAITAPSGSSTTSTPIQTDSETDSGSSESISENVETTMSEACSSSVCSSEGFLTKTCKKSNGVTSKEQIACTPAKIVENVVTATPTTSIVKNQTSIGIGQNLNAQISIKKAEIRSGNYIGSQGQSLDVRQLAQNVKELWSNNVMAQTTLNITAETNSEGKTTFTTMVGGKDKELKIMPHTAAQKALDKLQVKVCSSKNGCTLQLKMNARQEGIQYEMSLERNSKIFGLFNKMMRVQAYVDAETGQTTVHKPWWAFMATEPSE